MQPNTWPNLAAAHANIAPTVGVFSTATKRFADDNIVGCQPFVSPISLSNSYLTHQATKYDLAVKPGEAAKASGKIIPNITDGFSGAAPDRGAVIGGRPRVVYGATSGLVVAFTALTPTRVLDTRVGHGAPRGSVAAGTTVELQAAGADGIPSDAVAVTLNVTAAENVDSGYVTVFPCGQPQPHVSSVNFSGGENAANQITVLVGTNGKVCFHAYATTHVVADLSGYWSNQTIPSSATTYDALDPTRVLDSRTGAGMPAGATRRVNAGETVNVRLAGVGSVPADAVAVSLNVTATNVVDASYVTVYPCGVARPEVSNVNFNGGTIVANFVTVALGAGSVCLYSPVELDLVADLGGFFRIASSPQAPSLTAVEPSRVLDTRLGIGAARSPLDERATLELSVADSNGVPTNAAAVVLNLTAAEPEGDGYLTVYPCGTPRPTASNVNYRTGAARSNAVLVRIGAIGRVCIVTHRTTHVVADLYGYLAPAP